MPEIDTSTHGRMGSNKKIAATLAVLIVLAVAAVVYFAWFKKKPDPQPVKEKTLERNVEPVEGQKVLPINQLPQGITYDMILEDRPTLTDNYTYEKDGVKQSTVRYSTQKVLSRVMEDYEEYLKNNGWTLRTEGKVTSADMISFFATKDTVKFYVLITRGASGAAIVELTLVTR